MTYSAAIILAAGLGKRMKSERPKVLHPVCGSPMITYVLDAVERAGVSKTVVVVGHKGELVQECVADRGLCVFQSQQLGTGHAVMQAESVLSDFEGDVLVVCGDTPLLTSETLERLMTMRRERKSGGVVLTAMLDDPANYGRIVRDQNGSVLKIVEIKDCTPRERLIQEVNVGSYCFDAKALFSSIKEIDNKNAQGEYYLTDVVEIILKRGVRFDALVVDDWREMLGVNSRVDLAEAAGHMLAQTMRRAMENGVTIVAPSLVYIEPSVMIERDVVIEPFVSITGTSVIGEGAHIGAYSLIHNRRIASGEIIPPYTQCCDSFDKLKHE